MMAPIARPNPLSAFHLFPRQLQILTCIHRLFSLSKLRLSHDLRYSLQRSSHASRRHSGISYAPQITFSPALQLLKFLLPAPNYHHKNTASAQVPQPRTKSSRVCRIDTNRFSNEGQTCLPYVAGTRFKPLSPQWLAVSILFLPCKDVPTVTTGMHWLNAVIYEPRTTVPGGCEL